MSSKVIRGRDVQVEALAWRPGGVLPASAADAEPAYHDSFVAGSRGAATPGSGTRAESTEQEIENKVQEAFRAGLQQGEAAARQKAEAEIAERLQALARTTTEIASLRQQIRREGERELVELSLAIARRILHRELTIDPEALSALIKAAVHKIDLRETHRVRTHPDHAATISRCLTQIGAPAKIEVVADAGLERGAAVFETSRGTVDASVETQLAEIQHGFADLMEAHP
jgi:flagellar assembly protein FliH